MRRPLPILLLLACLLAVPTHAAESPFDAEIRRLQTFLGILNQELTTQYERIKALQQAIGLSGHSGTPPTASPDVSRYEDVAEQRRRDLARETSLRQQLDATLERIRDLEAQKTPLLERVKELITLSGEAARAPQATQ